jgi:hypothetical protein
MRRSRCQARDEGLDVYRVDDAVAVQIARTGSKLINNSMNGSMSKAFTAPSQLMSQGSHDPPLNPRLCRLPAAGTVNARLGIGI